METRLARIIFGGILFAAGLAAEQLIETPWVSISLFIPNYLVVGGDVVLRAFKTVFKGVVFDESFLMTVATAAVLPNWRISSTVDTSMLTGESLPREALPGQELLSGCINTSGVLTARVTKKIQ